MDRRFLTVLGVSLLFALVVSSVFYQMTNRTPGSGKSQPSDMKDVVIAAKPLAIGMMIKAGDVKVQKVPGEQFPKGGFAKVEEVLDRPVISNILLDEPVLDGRLAARGSGQGLAPVIPVGMRAVSVRVNDVSGLAGFVLPGMHVDILVTGRPPGNERESITNTVLQNILVLSAGTTTQPDARGTPVPAPTVSLLVTPEQAEIITLANNEGRIQLVLRNGSDTNRADTKGVMVSKLYGTHAKKAEPEIRPAPRPRPVAMAVAPIARPVLPAMPEQIVVIRGNSRTVEVIGGRNGLPLPPPPPVPVAAPAAPASESDNPPNATNEQ